MTTEPKEVNKVADKASGKKAPRQPKKSLGDLPVVKKQLAASDKRVNAFVVATKNLLKATKAFDKILSVNPAKRARKAG